MRMGGRRLGPRPSALRLPLLAACLLLPRMCLAGAPPTITKFENGSTVFVWDDGRQRNAANGDQKDLPQFRQPL